MCTSVWGVSLRQDEVLEVNDADSLSPKPTVRYHSNVVLGREGLKDGNSEHYMLSLSCYHLWGETHSYRHTPKLYISHHVVSKEQIEAQVANLFLLQEEVLRMIDVIIDGILHP